MKPRQSKGYRALPSLTVIAGLDPAIHLDTGPHRAGVAMESEALCLRHRVEREGDDVGVDGLG